VVSVPYFSGSLALTLTVCKHGGHFLALSLVNPRRLSHELARCSPLFAKHALRDRQRLRRQRN
jgi:hypothetical protein